MKEESIWVMDFPNQLIREKVMMEKPSNFDNYTNGFPEGAFFKSELKVFDEYKKHLASRRTFSYPVSKEQDGKEIKESEFRLQHQVQTMFNDLDEWTNCDEWTHDSMPIEEYRRIIAIPIGETDRQYEECLPDKPVRFKIPTNKQMVSIALIFNDGRLDPEELTNMVSMCQFVIDRLYENGDIIIPSSKEK